MERKHIMLSALSIGVGVSVGLVLASGQTMGRWVGLSFRAGTITEEQLENELRGLVVDGTESNITFEKFPYFLSKQTRELLTSAAHFRLKNSDFSKHTQNLTPARRAILLSGPSELYLQRLVKALAHFFKAKLLLLDATDFSLKVQSKYGCPEKESAHCPRKAAVPITNQAYVKLKRNWAFDEKHLLQSLYKVMVSESKTCSVILYIKDIEKVLLQSDRFYKLFKKMLGNLSGSVLILGSHLWEYDEDKEMDERVGLLFPHEIEVKEPDDETDLVIWEAQLEEAKKTIKFQENKNYMSEVLAANDLDCDDLGSVCNVESKILSEHTEDIVISAISHHSMNNKNSEYRNGKLVISSKSLSHGLSIFQEEKTSAQSKVFPPCNEYEKRLQPEVIPANKIGVTFDDIGAMNDIKESLEELVMLPLQKPDIFNGGLLKPCKGILLFGPPGTGKTMLAKAIANEAGASFINLSLSTITSKWFGDDEKNVRAVFTLASKISPTIIFVDEVDSMLGRRGETGEHFGMRMIKNEFMAHWDGLLTKSGERVLVLAATNRPFDLDEAIIRRFERRIMVGLPSMGSREMILKTLLAKEKAEDLDFKELATMTEGYTGSDIKNLCMTAAYRPIRELHKQERMNKDNKKKQKTDQEESSQDASLNMKKEATKGEKENVIKRPLNMEDMRQAKTQISASFASDGAVMNMLKEWNESYGEGGSRKKKQLTYFL